MKNLFFTMMLCAVFFAGCEEEEPQTSRNSAQSVRLTAVDAGGRDLLDPSKAYNILSDVRVVFGDKVYEPVTPTPKTRGASTALRLSYDDQARQYVLLFGEFVYGNNIRKEPVVVQWGDGREDVLELDYYLYREQEQAKMQIELYLDKWQDGSNVPRLVETNLAPPQGSDPDAIWDFMNYEIGFTVEDAQGRDLLDPETEGNILAQPIKAIMYGKVFAYEEDKGGRAETRYNMPRKLALRWRYSSYQQRYMLFFGEFPPDSMWMDATFVLDWGDGMQDKVQFDCYLSWKDYLPVHHDSLYLNGKQNESKDPFTVRIVK